MFLVPIGRDQSVRNFPWVTAALVAACLAVQVAQRLVAPGPAALAEVDERRSRAAQLIASSLTDERDLARPIPGTGAPEVRERAIVVDDAALQRARLGELGDEPRDAVRDWDEGVDALTSRDFTQRFGFRPARGRSWNVVLSLFVHPGWLLLALNLAFLWLCGANLEERWGPLVFGAFYLASGVLAWVVYGALHKTSLEPVVGASGAVAAAMGAFLFTTASAKVRFWYLWLVPPRAGTFEAPAWVAFGVWLIQQTWSLTSDGGEGGGQYSAHLAGFGIGFVVAIGLRLAGVERRRKERENRALGQWSEDPDYLAAVELVSTRRPREALPLFEATLKKNPRHPEARLALWEAAVEAQDAERLCACASEVILALAQRRELRRVLEAYSTLELRAPGFVPTDRALGQVTRAAIELKDGALCARVAMLLVKEFPASALAPKMIWDVAVAQEQAGRRDLARQTLEQLVRRYPSDPFAQRAREKLGA